VGPGDDGRRRGGVGRKGEKEEYGKG